MARRVASAAPEGAEAGRKLLAIGLRRSYGDSGLNPDGAVIDMAGLDRAIAFDPQTRLLRAEAGMSFDALLGILVPRGFFLPVTPGTRFVTWAARSPTMCMARTTIAPARSGAGCAGSG